MKHVLLNIILLFGILVIAPAQEVAYINLESKIVPEIEEPKINRSLLKRLNKYLANQVKYPQIALENQVEGLTRFSCYFDKHGKVAQIVFEHKIDRTIENEIMKTLNSMPKFTAAANQIITTTLHFRLK